MRTFLSLCLVSLYAGCLAQNNEILFKGAIDSAYFYHARLDMTKANGTAVEGSYKYDNQTEWISLSGTINPSTKVITLNEYVQENGTLKLNSIFKGRRVGSMIAGTWVKQDGKNKVLPFYFTEVSDLHEATTLCRNATIFTTAKDKSFPVRTGKVYKMIPDEVYAAGSVIWFDQSYQDNFTISFEYLVYDNDAPGYYPNYNSADGVSLILFKDKRSYEGVTVPNGGLRGFIQDGAGIGVHFNIYEQPRIQIKNGAGDVLAEQENNAVYTAGKWAEVSVHVEGNTIFCYFNGNEVLAGEFQSMNREYAGFGIGAGTGASDALHSVKNVRITRTTR